VITATRTTVQGHRTSRDVRHDHCTHTRFLSSSANRQGYPLAVCSVIRYEPREEEARRRWYVRALTASDVPADWPTCVAAPCLAAQMPVRCVESYVRVR
jgi:hypothetical protein